MAAAKQRRWTCTRCGDGLLAPSKPRRDDVRRYCLPCSKTTGRLVERTCPALERERAAGKAASTAKATAKRRSAASRRSKAKADEKARLDDRFIVSHPTVPGATVDLRKELPKVWRAARKVEPHLREQPPKLVASSGFGSYAYRYDNEIHLGANADWHTLVHEVAHFVRGRQVTTYRGDKRAHHDRAFYFVMRDLIERLIGLRVSFASVTSWGYVVDGVIRRQVRALRDEQDAA